MKLTKMMTLPAAIMIGQVAFAYPTNDSQHHHRAMVKTARPMQHQPQNNVVKAQLHNQPVKSQAQAIPASSRGGKKVEVITGSMMKSVERSKQPNLIFKNATGKQISEAEYNRLRTVPGSGVHYEVPASVRQQG